MNKYIVTTTINFPTVATNKFAQIATRDNWTFIIVGDLKTPHEEYEKLVNKYYPNVIYLNPETQENLYKQLSDAL